MVFIINLRQIFMNRARSLVEDFNEKHPLLRDKSEDLYDLYYMEVEDGNSEEHEFQLLSSSLEDLAKESW